MLPQGEVAMTSKSRAKISKKYCEPPRTVTGILIAIFLLGFCPLSVLAAGAKDLPVDGAGATVMSYHALLETPKKFDRKFVWVLGGLKFVNSSAYLGAVSAQGPDLQKRVCVEPIESFTGSVVDPSGAKSEAILRRFDGLGVSVHGRYESASNPQCPNGTLFVALLEISFE
jgi:hypothetical protein